MANDGRKISRGDEKLTGGGKKRRARSSPDTELGAPKGGKRSNNRIIAWQEQSFFRRRWDMYLQGICAYYMGVMSGY